MPNYVHNDVPKRCYKCDYTVHRPSPHNSLQNKILCAYNIELQLIIGFIQYLSSSETIKHTKYTCVVCIYNIELQIIIGFIQYLSSSEDNQPYKIYLCINYYCYPLTMHIVLE